MVRVARGRFSIIACGQHARSTRNEVWLRLQLWQVGSVGNPGLPSGVIAIESIVSMVSVALHVGRLLPTTVVEGS
jgi:hypothetical protein